MGTVAEKLTYLNGTKSSLKTAINNLGGDIDNNTTFRNYATELNDIYSNLPKVSDTGTNISLNPTLKGRLGIVPKGNTLQDGTPTPDTPVEIQSATGTQKVVVSGKNLANINEIEKTNNATIELNDNGFTYTRIAASSGDLFVATLSKQLKPNTTYSTYMTKDTGNLLYFYADELFDNSLQRSQIAYTAEYIAYTFTTDSTGYVVIGFYSTNSSQGGTGTIGNIVLTEGVKTIEELQKYQPYIEPQEVDIELSSRNLFDINNQTIKQDYAKDNDGNEIYSLGGNYTTSYTQVKPNTAYTFSYSLSSQVARIYYYTKDKTWISRTDNIKNSNNNYTFTTPNNCYYIQFQNVINFTMSNNIQLEKGSQATDYVPYYNYPLNKIGDYEDYIGGTPDNWVLYKNIGKVVLNGSEAWNYIAVAQGSLFRNYTATPNNSSLDNYLPISDYYKGIYYRNAMSRQDGNIYISNTSVQLDILDNRFTSDTAFKNWLSNNNVNVLYGLKNTQQTPITDENLVSQLNELYYLQSYNDTTNIDVTGNLPMRITASAIKGA